jgi:hypothetical protein
LHHSQLCSSSATRSKKITELQCDAVDTGTERSSRDSQKCIPSQIRQQRVDNRLYSTRSRIVCTRDSNCSRWPGCVHRSPRPLAPSLRGRKVQCELIARPYQRWRIDHHRWNHRRCWWCQFYRCITHGFVLLAFCRSDCARACSPNNSSDNRYRISWLDGRADSKDHLYRTCTRPLAHRGCLS